MKELIFDFVNQYAVWGILIGVLLVVFALWRMQRQLKKLNRSLGAMTAKIQEYFTVIMEEEQEEPQLVSTKEAERSTPVPARERERNTYVPVRERERNAQIQPSPRKVQSPEEEAVLQAVLKEYFS